MEPRKYTIERPMPVMPSIIKINVEEESAVRKALAALPYGSMDPKAKEVEAEVRAKFRAEHASEANAE